MEYGYGRESESEDYQESIEHFFPRKSPLDGASESEWRARRTQMHTGKTPNYD